MGTTGDAMGSGGGLISDPSFVKALIGGSIAGGCFMIIMYILAVVVIFCRFKDNCRSSRKKVENVPVIVVDPASTTMSPVLEDPSTDAKVTRQNITSNNNRLLQDDFTIASMFHQGLRRQILDLVLDKDRLKMDQKIGSGNFGVVYKACLRDVSYRNPKPVAVKVISGPSIDAEQMYAFTEEILRMRHFNNQHVLSMLGLIIDNNMPQIVMPFMENRDLRAYVSNPSKEFNAVDMAVLAKQVAEGMIYLGSQGIVHRDLAARNCMIDGSKVVKVADFGLSRNIFNSDYYRVQSVNPLPVRWMAVESIVEGRFSIKSDVWAFGIVIWELFTRGHTPYPDQDSNSVVEYIKSGERLKAPEHMPTDILALMMECWNPIPVKRPTFRGMATDLERLIQGAETVSDRDSHADYENIQFY